VKKLSRLLLLVFVNAALILSGPSGWSAVQGEAIPQESLGSMGSCSAVTGSVLGGGGLSSDSGDGSDGGGAPVEGGGTNFSEGPIDIPVPIAKLIDPPDARYMYPELQIIEGSESEIHFVATEGFTTAGATIFIHNEAQDDPTIGVTATANENGAVDVSLEGIIEPGENTFSVQVISDGHGSVGIFLSFNSHVMVELGDATYIPFSTAITNTDDELTDIVFNPLTDAINFTADIGGEPQPHFMSPGGGEPEAAPVGAGITGFQPFFNEDGSFWYMNGQVVHYVDTDGNDTIVAPGSPNLVKRSIVSCGDSIIMLDSLNNGNGALISIKADDLNSPNTFFQKPNTSPFAADCRPDLGQMVVFTLENVGRIAYLFDQNIPGPPQVLFTTGRPIFSPHLTEELLILEEQFAGGSRIMTYNKNTLLRFPISEPAEFGTAYSHPTVSLDGQFAVFEKHDAIETQLYIAILDPDYDPMTDGPPVNGQLTTGEDHVKPLFSRISNTLTFLSGIPAQIGIINLDLLPF